MGSPPLKLGTTDVILCFTGSHAARNTHRAPRCSPTLMFLASFSRDYKVKRVICPSQFYNWRTKLSFTKCSILGALAATSAFTRQVKISQDYRALSFYLLGEAICASRDIWRGCLSWRPGINRHAECKSRSTDRNAEMLL